MLNPFHPCYPYMLHPIVKGLIEEKIGKKIRYPADCEFIVVEIEKITKQRISTNTIKRLLGFIQGVRTPRLYTLDIIAKYLGFNHWE